MRKRGMIPDELLTASMKSQRCLTNTSIGGADSETRRRVTSTPASFSSRDCNSTSRWHHCDARMRMSTGRVARHDEWSDDGRKYKATYVSDDDEKCDEANIMMKYSEKNEENPRKRAKVKSGEGDVSKNRSEWPRESESEKQDGCR